MAHGGSLELPEYKDLEDYKKKKEPEKVDTRSAEEIAADMWQRIRGKA